MKSRKHYNKQLKALQKMSEEFKKKYGRGSDNSIIAFKLGYQTRISDEFVEKGIKI